MKSRGIYLELIFLCFQFLILTGLPSSTTGAKSPSVGSVRTKVGTNGTAPSTTTVKGPPKELTDAADKRVVSVCVRENAALECPLIGLPPPHYNWLKGNERIDSVWHRFEGTDQAQLIIRSVTHEDSGTYWCVAVNGFGSKNFSIELNVTGDDPLKNNYLKTSTQKRSSFNGSSPEIIRDHLPRESTVLKQVKGKNLMVKCEAKGNPKPNVTWYKDQQNLTSSRDSVATLKLFNLTDKDDGRYRCEASNKWDKDVYEMTLKVSEAWQEAAEILELNPSNLTLFPGQSGSITCLARLEGATLPLMLWVKRVDDPKLEANKTSKLFLHDGIYYEALNRTDMKETRKNIYATVLPINNASQADAGTYCCAVVGPMGINHSVAEVIIQADPHQVVSVQRRKSEAVQRAVLYALGILVVVLVVIFGYKRYHGCRGPLKNSSVAKKGGGKSGGGSGGGVMSGSAKKAATTVTTSSKRTSSTGRKGSSLMMAIGKTQVPKRSPGETLSTTLTQTQNDVLQPLVDNNNSRTVSTSESARRAGPLVPYHWPSGGVVLNCGGKHEKLFDQPGVYVDDRTGHYSSSCTSGASDIQTFRTSSSHRQHHHHQHRSPYHFSQQLQQQHGHHHHHNHHRGPCESKNVNYIRAEDDSPAMYFVNEVDRMPFPTNSPNTLAHSGVYRAGREKGSGGGKRWSSSYSAKNHSSSCSSPDHHHHHHEYRNDIDFTLPLSATHLPVPAPSWESLSSDESSNNSSIAHYYHPAQSRSQHHCHHHHHHHEERCPKLSHANNNNSLLSQ